LRVSEWLYGLGNRPRTFCEKNVTNIQYAVTTIIMGRYLLHVRISINNM
jgi:hypothetical protein